MSNEVSNAAASKDATINGAGQRVVPLPQNQMSSAAVERVSFQDLLCELVVSLGGGPKEFKAAEGKLSSLGFYGNGKVTLKGLRFQVQVSAQVVKSNEMQPGAERTDTKRRLGLSV